MNLSPRQLALLQAIREWRTNAGISPTLRELGNTTGISSTSVVNYNLDRLEAAGLIRRIPGVPRSIVLCEQTPPLTKAVYAELVDGLRELDEGFKRTPRTSQGWTWLEAQWRVENDN